MNIQNSSNVVIPHLYLFSDRIIQEFEYICKPAAYLSFHNQYKYCQLAEKYKLSVKLPFGIVGLALAVVWCWQSSYRGYEVF